MSSGAGQTTSRGPTALFYNPGNMIMAKFLELDFDVSLAQLRYQYQHLNSEAFSEPAVIQRNQPQITLSAAFRPVESFVLGFAYLPVGTGAKEKITNVPFELLPEANPGNYDRYTLVNKDTSQKLAFGFAYRPDYVFSIGLGLIRLQERFSNLIYGPDQTESDTPYVDALYGGAFNQTVLGIRSELWERLFVISLSYKTAVTKKYTGDVIYNFEGTEDYQAFSGFGYAPATLAFGIETRIDSIGFFGEVVSEQWSAGRKLFRRGIALGEPKEKDLRDTLNLAGGFKYWAAPLHMFQISFGSYPANVGDGQRQDLSRSTTDDAKPAGVTLQDEEDTQSNVANIAGVGFGEFEALPRTVFGAGYRYKIEDRGYMQFGMHQQAGSRQVSEGFDGEGSYKLSLSVFSLGFAFGL